MKTLAVIIGAGASKDCVAQGSISAVDENVRPPLTKDLFEFRPSFNAILSKYPKVEALSEEIRVRLRSGEGLERVLKEINSRPDLQVKKQVLETQMYLQELLWAVSDQFITSGGSKFDTLVSTLFNSPFEKILFITLNYDLLLEKAIDRFSDHAFADISSYCPPSSKWLLIKPHGSVNWGRALETSINRSAASMKEVLRYLSEEPTFSKTITMVSGHDGLQGFDDKARFNSGKILFPHLALPLEGEKEFLCPDDHLERLQGALADCTSFLFLGFSGLDPHVVDLMKGGPQATDLMVVSKDKKSAEEVFKRLYVGARRILPQRYSNPDGYLYDNGFAHFMESSEFRAFLKG